MTNGEKFKEVFKFGLKISNSDGFITRNMITCSHLSCSECPLNNACSSRGLKKWLKTEYGKDVSVRNYKEENKDNDEYESPAYKKGYEDGYDSGRNAVYSELSQIFKRR